MVYSLKSNSISIVIANTKYYIFTRQMEEKGACLSLFDLDNVRTSFATTVKKRDHGLHIYIILIVVVFNVTLLALQVMTCTRVDHLMCTDYISNLVSGPTLGYLSFLEEGAGLEHRDVRYIHSPVRIHW